MKQKNFKSMTAVIFFSLGIISFSLWQNYYFIKIPKENKRRSLASQSTGQQLVIDQLTEKVLDIRTKRDIDRVINEITKTAEGYPTFVGVQLFSATASSVKILKGLLWRLRGIVEDTDVTHTFILSRLRFIYASNYAYGPHLRALFHYIADPPEDTVQFLKISELQDTLEKRIKPILVNFLNRAVTSMKLPAFSHNFVFDRRLFMGEQAGKRFFDPEEARKEYIKPYTGYIISGLARTLGALEYVSNYNFDQLTDIMNDALKKSAINSLFGRLKVKGRYGRTKSEKVRSLPAIIGFEEIYDIVTKSSYKKFLTPRFSEEVVNKSLERSYKYFALAAEHDLKGYVCSIDYAKKMMEGADIDAEYTCSWAFMESESFQEEEYFIVGGSKFLVDPNQLLINHRQKFHELRDRYRIYHPSRKDGVVSIVSDATGGIVRINVREAFRYRKDLKNFLPIEYSRDINHDGIQISGFGSYNRRRQWQWNYDYGRPTRWRDDFVTFGGLLPDATNENIYDIMYNMRLTRSLRPFSNTMTTVP